MMLPKFAYKNKGILIPVYLFTCVVVSAIINRFLMEQFGGPFLIIDTYAGMGCACLLTALWVILTCDDYYKDKEGNKVKVDIRNEFFFIKMKYWSYIFVVLGLVLIGNIVFHYFPLA